MSNPTIKKARKNVVSIIIHAFIALLLLAIPVLVICRFPMSLSWRWGLFAAALLLILLQCIRIKHPMLHIDRIFANHPVKQIAMAFLFFVITFDLALCLFPESGVRSAFVDFISSEALLEEPSDGFRYEFDTSQHASNHDNVAIIEEPAQPISRSNYLKHGLIYFLGVFVFNGLLIATINRFMDTRAERYKEGVNTYKSIGNHYVFVGYGSSCAPIIRNICSRSDTDPSAYFLILSNQDVSALRRSIQTQLPDADERIVIYSGDMDSKSQLARLNIEKAKEVYILGEGREAGRDSKNLECAKAVKEIREKYPQEKTLHVNLQFDKPSSYSTLKRITIPDQYYKNSNGDVVVYLRPFNFFENWARLLWGTFGLDEYKTLDQGLMVDHAHDGSLVLAQRHVHLVIAGFNEMGEALLFEALRICHYRNYNEATGANKTRITIVDPKIDEILPRFHSQHPYLNQISDIEIEYRANYLEDEGFRESLSQWAGSDDTVLTVAICFSDSDNSLSAALSLPDPLYYDIKEGKIVPNSTTQILARQEIRSGLTELLDEENGNYANIKLFGMPEKGFDDTLLNDQMAIIINANYHFKYELGISKDFFELAKENPEETFKEAAKSWISLNEDKRFANRYQAEIYRTHQTYRKLLEQCPEILYQTEHMRWCAERSTTGYRDMHEENLKDGVYQFHNLIIPYHDLSDLEKGKDKDVLKNMDKVIELSKSLKEPIV